MMLIHTHTHTYVIYEQLNICTGCGVCVCRVGGAQPPFVAWPNVCLRLPFLTLDYFKCFAACYAFDFACQYLTLA